MAVSARELLLIIRAQNQASGALRRVAKDIGSMGGARSMRMQGQQLRITEQNLRRQRQLAANELRSIETGTRRIGLDTRAANIARQRITAELEANKVRRDGLDIAKRQYLNENQLDRIRNIAKKRGMKTDPMISEGIQSRQLSRRLLARQFEAATLAAKSLASQQSDLSLKSEQAAGAMNNTALAAKKLAAAEAEAAARAEYLRSRMAGLGQSIALQQQKISQHNKAIRNARWDNLAAGGRAWQHLGRVAQYAGIVGGAALLYAANGAAKFNQQATLVATQTGKVGTGMRTIVANGKYLEGQFLKIQATGTSSMEDINEAAYNLFSTIDQLSESRGGLAEGAKMMQIFSKAAIAGQVNITDVAEGVIGTLAAFDNIEPTAANVQKIMNKLFATVRFGRTNFQQLTESLTTLTPAAKSAGQTLETTLGTFAFLSKPLGVAKARVGIPRLMEVLTAPKMVTGLKKLGIQVADGSGKMFQLDKIIGNIVKKRPDILKNDLALMQFFKTVGNAQGTIQARRAFVFLAKNLEGYRRILRKVATDNNEFNRSLAAMESTTGVKWAKMVNQLKAFALMIGAAVIPQLLKLQPYLQKAVDWFNNLDKATRDKYAKWAVYAAGLLLVGSAFAFISGLAIRVVANLGKMIGVFPTLLVIILGVSAAISALTGNWDGLNGVITTFLNFGTGSWAGFAGMMALAAGSALKLRSALLGVVAAQRAGTASGITGGIANAAASLGSAFAVFRTGRQVKMAEGAGKLAANLGAAGAAVNGMSAALPVVVGALALAAGGALLWKIHTQKVREENERIAAQYERFIANSKLMQQSASRLGTFGQSAREAKLAKLDIKELQLSLKNMRAEFAKMPKGFARDMLGINIERTVLQLADAKDRLDVLQHSATSGLNAMKGFIQGYQGILGQIKRIQNEITRKQGQIAAIRTKPGSLAGAAGSEDYRRVQRLQLQIAGLRANIGRLQGDTIAATGKMGKSWNKLIGDMQRAAMLPARIGEGAREAARKFFAAGGAKLTPKNLKIFFRAYLDPKSNIPGQIAKAARAAKAKDIKFKATVEAAHEKLTFKQKQEEKLQVATNIVNDPNAQAKANKLWNSVDIITRKPHIAQVSPPPSGTLAGIGASISAGVQAGLDAHPVYTTTWQRTIQKEWGIKSPSEWAATHIGIPITEGVVQGMVRANHKLVATAKLQANLFTGAWIQAIESKQETDPLKLAELEQKSIDAAKKAAKKGASEISKIRAKQAAQKFEKAGGRVGIKDLIKDTKMQAATMKAFNDGLARLAARKVPKALLDQLAELGIDGVKYIKTLANASPKYLKQFVAAFNQMQKQISRSKRITIEEVKNMKAEVKKEFEDMADEVGQRLADMWQEARDTISSDFGELFSNIDPSTFGQGFEDAMSAWTENMQSLQDEMSGLNKELADLQAERAGIIADYNKEVIQIRADFIAQQVEKLQSAFGELFGGEFLQARKEWAAALKFSDIQRDLDEQLQRFKDWRQSLADAAARGIPAGLLKQLEELGPEGLDMVKLLASGTDQELTKYIGTWQEAQDMFKYVAEQQAATSDELAAQLAEALTRFSESMANMSTRIGDVLGKINDVAKEMRKVLAEMPQQATAETIIASIQKQIDAWNEYQGTLQALRDRGVPLEVIQQLEKLGIEAEPWLKLLVGMTDKQLLGEGGFVEKWKESQRLIDEATNRHMKDQLDLWFAHGANIALALVSGVHSQQQALVEYFSNLFRSLLEGYLPTYNPPPTGGYTGPGSGTTTTSSGLDPWAVGAMNSPGGRNLTGTTVNMNVNAVQGESLMSTLETASFRLSNRNIP